MARGPTTTDIGSDAAAVQWGMSVDMSSLRDLREAFHASPDPTLDLLVGEHRAELVGPLWLRLPAPLFLAVRGMPFWAGKRFDPPVDGVLHGVNVLRVRGFSRDSLPVTAQIEDVEGRSDLVIRYPQDAQWPWPHVVDRLRPLDSSTLIGLTFGMPAMPDEGTPFLLHRVSGG